jgi:hypothetical protein
MVFEAQAPEAVAQASGREVEWTWLGRAAAEAVVESRAGGDVAWWRRRLEGTAAA